MEKASGLELSWYLDYWIYSTKSIDYSIGAIESEKLTTSIALERMGEMPMPIDLIITLKNGNTSAYNIPLHMMLGNKTEEGFNIQNPWPWTHPEYELVVDIPKSEITKIEIDPTGRLMDIDRENNLKLLQE